MSVPPRRDRQKSSLCVLSASAVFVVLFVSSWSFYRLYDEEAFLDLNQFRANHSATLLPSGKLLIKGGMASGSDRTLDELYDPDSGTFSYFNPMNTNRSRHSATLLHDGTVLIAGGERWQDGYRTLLAEAAIFDLYGRYSAVGSLAAPGEVVAATLLADGRVLERQKRPNGHRGENMGKKIVLGTAMCMLLSPTIVGATPTHWEFQGRFTSVSGTEAPADLAAGAPFRIVVGFDTAATLVKTTPGATGSRYDYSSPMRWQIYAGAECNPCDINFPNGNIILRYNFSSAAGAPAVDGYSRRHRRRHGPAPHHARHDDGHRQWSRPRRGTGPAAGQTWKSRGSRCADHSTHSPARASR